MCRNATSPPARQTSQAYLRKTPYRTAAQRNPNPYVVIRMISLHPAAVCFTDYSTLEFGVDGWLREPQKHANSARISFHISD